MSSITSGIGLASGIPTAQIIDSLLASQSGTRTLLSNRAARLQLQQSSLLEISARLAGLQSTTTRFTERAFFNQFSAVSGDENVITARTTSDASPGVLNLTVRSLVTNHQVVSRGFADANTTPVGTGDITIEIGEGRLNQPTALGDLNAGAGVRRGSVRITDRSGDSAEIDLRATVDVQDILDAINNNGDIAVTARVSGRGIVLEDQSAGTGTLRVSEINGGYTAQDLGLLGSAAENTLTGSSIFYVAKSTPLSLLNDGNGIRSNIQGNDFRIEDSFNVSLVGAIDSNTRLSVLNNGNGIRLGEIRITNRAGASATIDLSAATTVGEVEDLINNAVDESGNDLNVNISPVTVNGEGRFTVTDSSTPPDVNEEDEDAELPELLIEDVTGFAARDLGILGSDTDGALSGQSIHRISTLGDVVRAINFAEGNRGNIVADLTEDGIRIIDQAAFGRPVRIEALTSSDGEVSRAAEDLGLLDPAVNQGGTLESRPLIAGLNTVLLRSLNGGQGVELGTIAITTRNAADPVEIDLLGADTVQDVLDRINAAGLPVEARLNAAGNGIALRDLSGGSAGNLIVEDRTGSAASGLGIAGSFASTEVRGSNLQLRYINENTRLEDLNQGVGVREGDIRITNALGESAVVSITPSMKDLDRVLQEINRQGEAIGISAAINATGDGLVINDASGGDGTLTIEDIDRGRAAADLNIAGEAELGEAFYDGSFEIRIEIGAGDTLEDVAARINDATDGVRAAVVNDGASGSAYRLSLTSERSGRRGELILDTGATDLGFATLVSAQDAVVLVGGPNGETPLVVSSSSNTLTGVTPGVEIDLLSVSDDPVSLNVGRDIDGIVADIDRFVTNYNAVLDRIEEFTRYNPETEERAPLQGDSTTSVIENRLARAVIGSFDAGAIGTNTLASVGVRLGNGARLEFNEQDFREKYAEDPAAVETLFADEDGGIGVRLEAMLDGLIDETDGLVSRRENLIESQVADVNDRIASFDDFLDRRRAQLERQFAGLESVIAGLQGQQSALAQLASLI